MSRIASRNVHPALGFRACENSLAMKISCSEDIRFDQPREILPT